MNSTKWSKIQVHWGNIYNYPITNFSEKCETQFYIFLLSLRFCQLECVIHMLFLRVIQESFVLVKLLAILMLSCDYSNQVSIKNKCHKKLWVNYVITHMKPLRNICRRRRIRWNLLCMSHSVITLATNSSAL